MLDKVVKSIFSEGARVARFQLVLSTILFLCIKMRLSVLFLVLFDVPCCIVKKFEKTI